MRSTLAPARGRDVCAELDALRADLDEIKYCLSRRGRPVRDDGRLLRALFAASPDCVFSSAEMLAYARLHGELADALAAAGIETARQLGKALQRCLGRSAGGIVVTRHGVDHHGTIWSLSESESGATDSQSRSVTGA